MVTIARRKPMMDQLLLLDGISRSGKFLLGKVISHFERVDYFQYATVLEHMPILWRMGLISTEAAVPFLQVQVELRIYDQALGRCLNTRTEDSSSIHHSTDKPRYLKRAEMDGDDAYKSFLNEKRIPSFVTHEILPHARLFLDAFPYLKMVNIQRHPVDIIYSWAKRSFGSRFGQDPTFFVPMILGKETAKPWFTRDWDPPYESMSPMDRCVQGVLSLQDFEQKAYSDLNDDEKKQVMFLAYERLVSNSNEVTGKVSEFLGTEPFENMESILKRERCFRELPTGERCQKFEEIGKEASPKSLKALMLKSNTYEKHWGLGPLK
jgi:hypothetical protein